MLYTARFWIVVLIVILALGFFTVTDAMGMSMGTGRADACRTYNVNGIFGGTENMDSQFCGESVEEGKDTSGNAPQVTPPVVIPPTPQPETVPPTPQPDDKPEQTPPTPDDTTPPPSDEEEEKDKCNKGEGNGGEGCDPGNHPENGNDDEDDGNNGPDNDNGNGGGNGGNGGNGGGNGGNGN